MSQPSPREGVFDHRKVGTNASLIVEPRRAHGAAKGAGDVAQVGPNPLWNLQPQAERVNGQLKAQADAVAIFLEVEALIDGAPIAEAQGCLAPECHPTNLDGTQALVSMETD